MKKVEPKKYRISNFFNSVVNIYIYGVITGLIIYMITTLIGKFYELIENIVGTKSEISEGQSFELLQYHLLHDIAFTIVLVKAYIILMEYARKKHINIKYTIEIAIIAPVVEIIFNYNSYDFQMIIFLGIFAFSMSVIYLFFYEKLQKVEQDYSNIHKH